jgi:hypothetical protein
MCCASPKNGASGKASLALTPTRAHRARVIRALLPSRHLAAALVLMALAMRVLVPSGWMPTTERGFALTICTGVDTQTIWMDSKGKLHKEDPTKGDAVEHSPCAFAGAPPALAANADMAVAAIAPQPRIVPSFVWQDVTVGHGLAAPPPPAIGPPSFA